VISVVVRRTATFQHNKPFLDLDLIDIIYNLTGYALSQSLPCPKFYENAPTIGVILLTDRDRQTSKQDEFITSSRDAITKK